jgi:hypothetical protein
MQSLVLHRDKPNMLHSMAYLVVLNVFWSLCLLLMPHFNIAINNPWLILTALCFIWHTACSIAGIELYTYYPLNLLIHLAGSICITLVIFSLI